MNPSAPVPLPSLHRIRSGCLDLLPELRILWEELKAFHLAIDTLHPAALHQTQFDSRCGGLRAKARPALVSMVLGRGGPATPA